jgi:hypothetical protein
VNRSLKSRQLLQTHFTNDALFFNKVVNVRLPLMHLGVSNFQNSNISLSAACLEPGDDVQDVVLPVGPRRAAWGQRLEHVLVIPR